MPSFEAAVPHNRASSTTITTADQLQRPQSRKDSMEPGTESMLWHMMNDMHRAIDVDNSQLHDEKHASSVLQTDHEYRMKLDKRRKLFCQMRAAIGVVLVLAVLIVTIVVSEMKK